MATDPKVCHSNNRWLNFFRKWHRWPGLILGFFFILWALSGIVMNHRQLFSGFDINRKYLAPENRYLNWNNAAVKSAVQIGTDSLLIYGNIGIWLTNNAMDSFIDFNTGFPEGIDNRKISSMLVTRKGHIYAGTLFGLYYYDPVPGCWIELEIPSRDRRIQWLESRGDQVLILTRSELFKCNDDPKMMALENLPLQPYEGYDNKAGLFRTIWVIHSGEIYGMTGKLIVDALGLVVILLTVTGILHFLMPFALRRLKKRKKSLSMASATKRTSAKWHKKAGIWIFVFLLINTVTGMFLRPPLLITIADARVGKIPWSMLDTPNPWEDKLRAMIYDEEEKGYLFGTSEGIFFADEELTRRMVPLPGQPPLSVMGINVFRKTGPGTYLVGTFNGLYDWMPGKGISMNHMGGEMPKQPDAGSKPFGDEMVSGYLELANEREIYFDYNRGAVLVKGHGAPPPMPVKIIENSPMSWWNFALEVHTGRIFKPLMGDLYILIVPLLGLFGTTMVISGLIVWIKLYARKNR